MSEAALEALRDTFASLIRERARFVEELKKCDDQIAYFQIKLNVLRDEIPKMIGQNQ